MGQCLHFLLLGSCLAPRGHLHEGQRKLPGFTHLNAAVIWCNSSFPWLRTLLWFVWSWTPDPCECMCFTTQPGRKKKSEEEPLGRRCTLFATRHRVSGWGPVCLIPPKRRWEPLFLVPLADRSTEIWWDSGARFHRLRQSEEQRKKYRKLFPFQAEGVWIPHLASPALQDLIDLGWQRACRIILVSTWIWGSQRQANKDRWAEGLDLTSSWVQIS